MVYFREEEKEKLRMFAKSNSDKAMAIYGRRRTGKTSLVTDFHSANEAGKSIYYQCTGYDYRICLADFIQTVRFLDPESDMMEHVATFRELFQYLVRIGVKERVFIIDEFPFIAKGNENTTVEFQWIIDHGLGNNKLILLGSSLSFMKRQISDNQAPLYGRFDKIMEIRPFTFQEVQSLFPSFEAAMEVYSKTGGVAQYVMYYRNYPSVKKADNDLFFNPDGRLFKETENLLLQEVREVSTYTSILRAIGTSEKESGKIAEACRIDQRAVFSYLNKLEDLGIISVLENPLSDKKKGKRYYISDMLFRFHYAFIEPHISMITALREKAADIILDDKYSEYLGFVYEAVIRNRCYELGVEKVIPFIPKSTGKWWGNICEDGEWKGTEADVIAYDDNNIVIGECKYRKKAIGMKELDYLKLKARFIPVKGRKVFYLLAGKSGFTKELQEMKGSDVILLKQTEGIF